MAGRRTHACTRNGTTSLFFALDIATGAVIGKCYERHRSTEFLDVIKQIDRQTAGRTGSAYRDGQSRHPQNPEDQGVAGPPPALARHPHWHVHFTPTSASWITQVERWFAELIRKQLQRGVHRSTAELEADITAFIDAHNEAPVPYKWVKSADEIRASVKRFCQRTQKKPCAEA